MEEAIAEELNQGKASESKGQKRRRMVCELVLDFAKNSTLHGLRYFAARGLTALEKTFWVIIFLTSLVLCVLAMRKVYVKWQTSPIIISIDDHLMSASEVPFPAVTVCPQAKIDQDSFNYTKHWITFKKFMHQLEKENVTREEEVKQRVTKFMEKTPFMNELVNVNFICNVERIYDKQFVPYASGHTLVQNIIQAAPDANGIVWYGQWRNTFIKKSDTTQIAPVLTEEGLCFTFNSLATEEIFHMDRIQTNYSYMNATAPGKGWSLERGYSNSTGHDVYPRRGQGSGYRQDLLLFLSEVKHRDFLCDSFDQGFKVYLHHPADLPQLSLYHYAAQAHETASFAIKINVVTTSEKLIKYPPHIRQCYFPSEKSLRYFRAYTPNNCRLECLTNHTLARCGCVLFHMPHLKGLLPPSMCLLFLSRLALSEMMAKDLMCLWFRVVWDGCLCGILLVYTLAPSHLQRTTSKADAAAKNAKLLKCNTSTGICLSLDQKACFYRALREYSAAEDGFGNLCYCLPSCYSVQYEAEVTKNYFDVTSLTKAQFRAEDEVNNVSRTHTIRGFKETHLEMYFKEARFATMRRSELYGPTDFLANCGGLLGLFLGFSFLSVVEVIYFCTLRRSSKELNQGDEGSKSRRRKSGRMLRELVLDFAKNSTLHGLRYFTERLTALEKIFWAIIVLTSVVFCVWSISNTWVKWQTSPIINSVDDHLMSASEVPFPAVTICPQQKINIFKFNYTDNWITFGNMSHKIYGDSYISEQLRSEEKDKRMKKFMDENRSMYDLANVVLICNDIKNSLAKSNLAPYVCADTLVQDIIKVAPDANVVYDGTWRNTLVKETMFDTSQLAPVLTQEGICFTFNGLATEEIFHMDRIQTNYSYLNATVPGKGWSLEHGYFNSTGHDVYPRRGQASGYEGDLKLTLREYNETRDTLCDYGTRGYKVYVHHPADLPQTSLYHHMAQPNEDVTFAIKINVVTTSDSLINYPPLSRQCYFPSEKSLRYFRAYTPSNCRLECLTNHTLERCGCVYFHMPRYDSALCISLDQRACFFNALREYSAAEDGFGNRCHCLPPCYSVQYEAEVTKSYTEYRTQYSYTSLVMYFKEARFATMRRSELYGSTDFLASCGGLLGLFLGFSFLSLVEFFYFFIIRLGCMFREKKVRDEAKKTNDVNIPIPLASKL